MTRQKSSALVCVPLLGGEEMCNRLTCPLEIQHNTWLLTLRGALALSPNVDDAKRVLDLGTGSGIWAIDYADTHPDAEVCQSTPT